MGDSVYNEYRTSVKRFTYDTAKYPFYTKIQEIYGVSSPLEDIHTQNLVNIMDVITFENDTKTDYHKMYYKSPMYKDVVKIYDSFIRDVVCPMFPEDIVVQKEPSYRIGIPNNTVLGKLTTDTDDILGLHCDNDYNHPEEEINFMLSITGQHGTNSCYVESSPGKGDFTPLTINKGEFVSFYGNKCRHHSKINTTGQTRISFDFRVIPYSEYKESPSSAIRSGRKFCIGEYYTLYKKD